MRFRFDKSELAVQAFRFLVVGGSNLAVTYCVYLIALMILPPVTSILVAAVVGLIYTTVLNINAVFNRKVRPAVVTVNLIYYAIYGMLTAFLLDIVIRRFRMPALLAPVPVFFAVVPIHFFCTRFVILRIGIPLSDRRDD
jgi:putative flippase GtrA